MMRPDPWIQDGLDAEAEAKAIAGRRSSISTWFTLAAVLSVIMTLAIVVLTR